MVQDLEVCANKVNTFGPKVAHIYMGCIFGIVAEFYAGLGQQQTRASTVVLSANET
jgi:hypothetical protein